MAGPYLAESQGYSSGPEGHVRGTRRQKVYGYIRAANELRQSYQSQWQQNQRDEDDEQGMPGAFPDVEIVRSGDEEMVLFPSYARKHVKKRPATLAAGAREVPGSHDDIEDPETGDADYWKREWERYEDDNAVVDVDVRGWIYTPHKGPINRKNRLLIAVARKLSGIPAPDVIPGNIQLPHDASHTSRLDHRNSRHEDEAAAKEAQSIVQKGEKEIKIAWLGAYSEDPSTSYDSDSLHTLSPLQSREFLPGHRGSAQSLTDMELAPEDDDPALRSFTKRQSWNHPSQMTKEELATANTHLMSRLKPFMHTPLADTAITVFFFNDQKSRSRSIHTNESGHFNVRASLDFVPTSIRVLASEKLSATEKIIITEEKGVSLVSDIDDTIKHSAISSGAREIFKNTFIRELGDLTIQGVKEWYTKMAAMGVKMHYVSNSPWQLYPLLKSYFALAGLPPGSFHLKQYTGMLQGIFEPAAERKRGSLERIMHDFPERKFILVGDSGEADLEVYSDVVSEHPGRVLAVFIRDVTTPEKKKFFDQNISNTLPDSEVSQWNGKAGTMSTTRSEIPGRRPALSNRQTLPTRERPHVASDQTTGDLIDFETGEDIEEPKIGSYSDDLLALEQSDRKSSKSSPPGRPVKPAALRGTSTESRKPTNHERIGSSKDREISPGQNNPTPPPPKQGRPPSMSDVPSTAAHTQHHALAGPSVLNNDQHHQRPNLPAVPSSQATKSYRPRIHHRKTASAKAQTESKPASTPPEFYNPDYNQHNTSTGSYDSEGEGYAATARRQLSSVYNALPTIRSQSPAPEGPSQLQTTTPPSKKGVTSYPAAAVRWATGASGGDPAAGGDGGALPATPYNKKEEIWKRRWKAAEELMKKQGVVLRTWRVGGDVMDECVKIVERGKEELERESGRRGGVSLTGQKAHRGSA